MLRYASAVLTLLEQADSEFGTLRSKQSVEPLKIGGSYGASTRLLPALVARFKKQHPEIPIALRSGSSKTLEKMLLNSETEIALVHMKPANSQLCAEPFRKETLIVFVARSHPLARKKKSASPTLTSVSSRRREEETARRKRFLKDLQKRD